MPVHIHLLVESGIHIIENLNLEGSRVIRFMNSRLSVLR